MAYVLRSFLNGAEKAEERPGSIEKDGLEDDKVEIHSRACPARPGATLP